MRYVCSKASSSDDADFIVCRGLGDCYLVLVGCVGGCCFNNEANKSFIWHHRPGDALPGDDVARDQESKNVLGQLPAPAICLGVFAQSIQSTKYDRCCQIYI
jgi:hypothetical protein